MNQSHELYADLQKWVQNTLDLNPDASIREACVDFLDDHGFQRPAPADLDTLTFNVIWTKTI